MRKADIPNHAILICIADNISTLLLSFGAAAHLAGGILFHHPSLRLLGYVVLAVSEGIQSPNEMGKVGSIK
jgi:hypothetical protein